MYVVKLKRKDHNPPKYINGWRSEFITDLGEDSIDRLKKLTMSLEEARQTMKDELLQARDKEDYFTQQEMKIDYIAIVRLSKYPPHGEVEVVDYQEVK